MTAPVALAVLEALPQAISAVDGAGRLAYANRAFFAQSGVAPDTCPPGTPLRDLVRMLAYRGLYGAGDPETQAEAILALDRSRPLRRQIGLPDGSRSFETISLPLPDGGFVNVAHDITALLRAREEQAARARLLEGTLARLRGGVARFDEGMRLSVCNPAYESLIGLAGGTLHPGTTHRDIIAMLDTLGEFAASGDQDEVRARMEADRAVAATRTRRRPSGEVLRFDTQPMPDRGCLIEVTDITALKRADDEATRRAAQLDGLLAALPHGVCVYGPDRRVQMFNAAYARMMEGSAVEVGELLDDVVARRLAQGEYDAETARSVLARFTPNAAGLPPLRRRRRGGRVIENSIARTPEGGFVSVFTDVTALHAAEEAARQRAALLDGVLDALPHGVCVYGPDRRVAMFNEAYARIMEGAEIRVGDHIDLVVSRRVAAGEFSPDYAVTTLQTPLLRETERGDRIRRRPNGTVIAIRGAPLPDGGHISVVTDVTALHRAEEELRRRAAILEASFAAMRHGIAVFGPDGRLLAGNDKLAALTGVPAGHVRAGVHLAELIEAQVAHGVIAPETGEMAKALDRRLPHRHARVGPDRVVEVMSDPTPDGGFVITFADVTALHRAEQEVRRRAALQEAMLGTIRHGIILYGPDRRVLATNAKTTELTGMPADRLAPGRLMDELIDEQVARGQIAPAQAAEMKAFDRSRPLRYSRDRPDGRVLDTVSEPTPDGGYVITYSDVTEDRRIRAELERARIAAEAASEAKSRFLATMSHELRTPLNVVIGLSEAIGYERDLAQAATYAAMINEAGRQLLQLVDDILDVARSQTGTLEAGDAPVSAAAVIAGALEAIAPAAALAGLELSADIAPALPALRGDARRLRQVLDKLLSNALKFTPRGGRVTVTAGLADGALEICVADTGIGVPAAERERMFEPFTQLDSSLARRFQGSGLGLHLARSIAATLGGTLTLQEPCGPGTRAVLRFPPGRLIAGAAALAAAAGPA